MKKISKISLGKNIYFFSRLFIRFIRKDKNVF